MHTSVECLSCDEVEALGHFQLSDMRYENRNVVTERVIATVLKFHTGSNFRTSYSVPEVDLRLPGLLRWSSLEH